MSDQGNMQAVWKLVGRARPHLRASQLLTIGAAFQVHRREILALAAGLGGLPDAELAQQLVAIARRVSGEGSRR